MEAGKLSIHPEPFRLRNMIDEAVRTMAPSAFEKGLELMYDVDDVVPDRVVGDALRIRQVLTNLITNAVTFTSEGEVVVSVECETLKTATADVRFTITDTGAGVAAEDQRRIFEPFIQSDATTATHQGGAGLGLSICRELVRCMGGELGVQSEIGKGSCFWFQLPLTIENQDADHDSNARDLTLMRGLRVLVVDRNEASRQVLQRMLERLSMVAETAVDYDHMIGKLYRAETEGRRFRLVIVDVKTADVGGTMLLERLAESLDDVPAAVLMKHAGRDRSVEDDGDAERPPAVVYLEKPICPTRLRQAVRRALGLEFSATHARPKSVLSQTASRALSILLAEDAPANQEVVTNVLSRRGHRVTVVNNGEEAVAATERDVFDVVLMDVAMPVMDGYEATVAIRRQEKCEERRVPIIALTAHASQGDRDKCAAVGMDGYVAKPIDVCQLVELVESAAESRPLARHVESQPTAVGTGSSAAQIEGGDPSKATDAQSEHDGGESDGGAIIDYRGAMQRLGGDEGLFRDFVRIFSQDTPGLLHTIRRCIDEVDAVELLRAAHSLKGLAASLGAKDAVDRAHHLERIAKSRCLKDAVEAADELEREVARVIQALSPYRDGQIAEPEAPLAQ